MTKRHRKKLLKKLKDGRPKVTWRERDYLKKYPREEADGA